MAIKRAGAPQPRTGSSETKVMTTMGLRERRAPRCERCGERRDDQLYTRNGNGQMVCMECASPRDRALLNQPASDVGDAAE